MPSAQKPKQGTVSAENLDEAKRLKSIYESKLTLRKSRGVGTQEAFGQAYDIGGQAAVWQFLNGHAALSKKAAVGFANGLDCRVADFSPRLDAEINNLARGVEDGERVISMAPRPFTDALQIPLMGAWASMGHGAQQVDHDEVMSTLTINRPWLARQASFTSPGNLALITGYGDSMSGTFEDGDVLIVDRGVVDIKVDAVYVLELNDELYIKRLQRRPDGNVLMISDNKKYEPYTIENGDREKFRVLGRVILAWNARRL